MTTEEQAPAAGHPLLGTKVGSYRITRELARGGMGVVFEAVHESLGQRAAVKVLADELIQDPNYALYADRFFTEAKAISIIQHPGIVKLYDHGKLPSGTVFIMMEFLDGQTLASLIEQGGQRGPRQPWVGFQKCVGITRQVASALAEAHKKSILHRDLKPGNVMLIPDPEQLEGVRTKLLDFGIARFLDSPNRRTAAGTVMGTPPYMSPEQCMGQEVDAKTDVYALGIMMYEMLVGQPPFFENNMTNILVAHVNQAPKPVREHVPSTPKSLHSLIEQMLAKSSTERPTMVQVVTQLRAIEQELRRASAATMVSPGSGPTTAEPDDATRMMAEPKASAQAPTRIYPAQPAVSRRTQLILFAVMGLLTLVALFWILRPVFQ